ncbi:hypothetical protein EWB00_007514 [Schistosoma japonicum]|uniref:DUF4515 domain-containing protein n=1 Tax=Schistosoma japonicum TaxID=6182 RepID=A0A4Z2CTX7_SCHJA|nr:hypothetical protein EWB00_007514 [Schistosoma japonicum]
MTAALISSPEDEIFMDKEELLREEHTKLVSEIEAISQEMSEIQNELLITEHLIQEQEVKNNECNLYLVKKKAKRLANTITLKDYHVFTLNELKEDRNEMLSMYAKRKLELRDVLLQEKNLLKHFKEELVSTTDIQLIRQKQESEIERLENEIKASRTFQSEQLNQFKEMSKQKQLKLENEALVVLDNVTKESKKDFYTNDLQSKIFLITNNLIVEYVNKICKENEELYQDILSRLDKIKVMEIEKSNLQRQNDEIKRNRMFSKDLEYLEYKRSEGLSLLNKINMIFLEIVIQL